MRAGSAAPGSASSSVSGRRSSSRSHRLARARAELGQRREGASSRSKNITAAGVVRRAALEPVEPIDALARVRLGGEPVDGVGREECDPADRDAALEGLDLLARHGTRPTVMRSQLE